jgi:hypothetical protein
MRKSNVSSERDDYYSQATCCECGKELETRMIKAGTS